MNLAIMSTDGFLFLLRWFHFFFGIIWIGLLYYFNFVQGPFFAETDAATKSGAIQKLVPRALWWFRWGAMLTFLTGWTSISIRWSQGGGASFASTWGTAILTGGTLGSLMWANVWFIIWPNQKVVIQSAQQVAGGGTAIPSAAACGARAGVASRTNVLFSIPMLFFMGAASHLPIPVRADSKLGLLALIYAVILIALEGNAIKGKTGLMTTVKGVITCGFLFAAVLYGLMEALL